MTKLSSLLLGLLLSLMAFYDNAAHADVAPLYQFTMQFTVSGFGAGAPTDPVTGTIVYESTGIHDPIQSFDSINMTIGGHDYSTGEIGYYRFATPNWDQIGGLTGGVGTLYNETDDFEIRWYRDLLTPFDFIYTSSQVNGILDSAVYNPVSFLSFNINQTPEPAVSVLLLSGAVLVVVFTTKQRLGVH
jgi:hypothetical protein